MKFSKTYHSLLLHGLPSLPPQYHTTNPEPGIQYKQMKKAINGVEKELEGWGLGKGVLRELLEASEREKERKKADVVEGNKNAKDQQGTESDLYELEEGEDEEYEDEDEKLEVDWKTFQRRLQLAMADARDDQEVATIQELDANLEEVVVDRLEGDMERLGVSSRNNGDRFSGGQSNMKRKRSRNGRKYRRPSARYEIGGTLDRPEPRLRLVFPPSNEEEGWDIDVDVNADGNQTHIEESTRFIESPSSPPYDSNCSSPDPPPPAEISIEVSTSGLTIETDEPTVSDSGTTSSQEISVRPGHAMPLSLSGPYHHQRRREICIPLTSDREFFLLFTSALASLAALQLSQKASFTSSVTSLVNLVAKVSSPSLQPSKSDLYAWREIFSLWIEEAIFVGINESDRGKERSLEESEMRFGGFLKKLDGRGLGKGRRWKRKESKEAFENFVRLNVQLLDLKRFELANREAARKILKKHDKRTALTAANLGVRYIFSNDDLSSATSNSSSRSSSALAFYSSATGNSSTPTLTMPGLPSLPQILLASLTDTLLPIIPTLDDYTCPICADIAFKPFRLNCGHFFCLRCLVKMQKRSQNACPECRAPVVMSASGDNLDQSLMEFMALWFPKETKQKQKSNNKESANEDLGEIAQLDVRCLIM